MQTINALGIRTALGRVIDLDTQVRALERTLGPDHEVTETIRAERDAEEATLSRPQRNKLARIRAGGTL
jgi:hypothetical protein